MTKPRLDLLTPYLQEEYRERLLAVRNTAVVAAWLEGSWEVKMQCPRRAECAPLSGMPTEDEWRAGDNTCSYCGSLNPASFMALVDVGAEVGPTDKNYKVYVKHDSIKSPTGKFYFQHLDEDQKRGFIERLNERKVNIGYPGHFYVLPYFCAVAK